MVEFTLPLPAEDFIPHRLPLRLVDRLLEVTDKKGLVEACIRAESPLVDGDGQLEEVALIELMAQAYAALKGYLDRRDNLPVRQGFLVGIKKIVRHGSAQVDDLLQIRIQTLAELDDFAVAAGEIWCREQLIAAGDIKVWIN